MRVRIILLVFVLMLVSVTIQAQSDSMTCPALVEQALNEVGNNCLNMGRNVACYGYKRIAATFTEPQPVGYFSIPSDRASLGTLQNIQTAPLDLAGGNWGVALMNVQANVPATLPGQAVTFVLMGDAQLKNAVSPSQAIPLVDPITVTVQTTTTMRTGPSLTDNAIGAAEAGTTLPADGISNDGEWVRIVYDNTVAWVPSGSLNPADPVSALPFIGPESLSPMQAFYFSAGLGVAACKEAPTALAIQSPENITVDLTVNGADIQIGSFVTFQSSTADSLVMTVHNGSVKTVADGQVTKAGESRVAVLGSGGDIVSWGAPRPATSDELQVGKIAQQFVDKASGSTQQVAESTTATTTTVSTTTTTTTCAAGVSGEPVYHVVQRGENLFRIALRYSTSVAEIASANNIANIGIIYVGQRLVIPRPCSGFINMTQPMPVTVPVVTTTVTPVVPLTQGVACGGFVPTSPLDGWPWGNVPFYWDPAPGAESYRVNIYNNDHQYLTSYSTQGPETHVNIDTRGFGSGQRYYWEVQALAGGASVCTTTRVSGILDFPPALTASWACGPGAYEFTVDWENSLGDGTVVITYYDRYAGSQTVTPSGTSGSVTIGIQSDVSDGLVSDPMGREVPLYGTLRCYPTNY